MGGVGEGGGEQKAGGGGGLEIGSCTLRNSCFSCSFEFKKGSGWACAACSTVRKQAPEPGPRSASRLVQVAYEPRHLRGEGSVEEANTTCDRVKAPS